MSSLSGNDTVPFLPTWKVSLNTCQRDLLMTNLLVMSNHRRALGRATEVEHRDER